MIHKSQSTCSDLPFVLVADTPLILLCVVLDVNNVSVDPRVLLSHLLPHLSALLAAVLCTGLIHSMSGPKLRLRLPQRSLWRSHHRDDVRHCLDHRVAQPLPLVCQLPRRGGPLPQWWHALCPGNPTVFGTSIPTSRQFLQRSRQWVSDSVSVSFLRYPLLSLSGVFAFSPCRHGEC